MRDQVYLCVWKEKASIMQEVNRQYFQWYYPEKPLSTHVARANTRWAEKQKEISTLSASKSDIYSILPLSHHHHCQCRLHSRKRTSLNILLITTTPRSDRQVWPLQVHIISWNISQRGNTSMAFTAGVFLLCCIREMKKVLLKFCATSIRWLVNVYRHSFSHLPVVNLWEYLWQLLPVCWALRNSGLKVMS